MKHRIDPNHPHAVNGVPVITDYYGKPLPYNVGLKAILKELDWSKQELAKNTGYTVARSLDVYFRAKKPLTPPAHLLNQLSKALHIKYAVTNIDLCPKCGSDEPPTLLSSTSKLDHLEEYLQCVDCLAKWHDIYKPYYRVIDGKRVPIEI